MTSSGTDSCGVTPNEHLVACLPIDSLPYELAILKGAFSRIRSLGVDSCRSRPCGEFDSAITIINGRGVLLAACKCEEDSHAAKGDA